EMTSLSFRAIGANDVCEHLEKGKRSVLERLDASVRSTVVCPLKKIKGFEAEYACAMLYLPPQTSSLVCTIFITKHKAHYYLQSNYCPRGNTESIKLATNETADLFELYYNIVTGGGAIEPSQLNFSDVPRQLRPATRLFRRPSAADFLLALHRCGVRYLIDERIMLSATECELDLNGAREIAVIPGAAIEKH